MLREVLKKQLAKRGLMVVRPRTRFGFDPWSDITRLSGIWKYNIRTIFDVGANDGDTARTMLERFGQAAVHCFEPHPETFASLVQRMKYYNGCKRLRAWPIALSDFSGATDLYEYGYSKVASMVPDAQYAVRFAQKPIGHQQVECATIDDFLAREKIDYVDILKIDTEGCDHLVLRGASASLALKSIRFVYAEFNDYNSRPGTSGGSLSAIAEILDSHGLRLIATYNDTLIVEDGLFSVSNVLFALPPPKDDDRF